MEYELIYKLEGRSTDESKDSFQTRLDYLSEIGSKLVFFLQQNSSRTVADPFLNRLNRMINDETHLSRMAGWNDSLKKMLEGFKTKHEYHYNQMQSKSNQMALSNIYELIKVASEVPEIKIQLAAVQVYRQRKLENRQHTVCTKE